MGDWDRTGKLGVDKIGTTKLTYNIDPTKNIIVDISLYHASFCQIEQYFNNDGDGI